jgi:hypothetical protein
MKERLPRPRPSLHLQIGQRSASFSARTHKIIGPPPDTLAETRPELARCEDLVTE